MQEFLRRNFWVVNLAVIGLGSYLLAAVVTEFAATAIMKGSDKGSAEGMSSTGQGASRSVKPHSSNSLAATLIGRNPFDAEPEMIVGIDVGDDDEREEGELEESDLGVDLLGTLVSENPEWSMATIRVQGSAKLVRIGTTLLDRADIVVISSRYIIVQEGDDRKVVKLWDKKSEPEPKGPGRFHRHVTSVSSKKSENEFSKGVKKVGPHEYHIDKGMLEENLSDLTKLGSQARIIPNYVDGKYHGFRVVGIRPSSLYRAIGLHSGDLVTRVNGMDIDTPNKAIQLFEQLRTSSTIALDLKRRGRKVTLTYKVK